MGSIIKLLNRGTVETPYYNNYMSFELTENIHFHYRNLRLEMTPEEFLFMRDQFLKITPEQVEEIKNHKYGYDERTIYLRTTGNLPDNNWWRNKFQIEKNKGGSVHFHINNIRLDLSWNDYKKIFEAKNDR